MNRTSRLLSVVVALCTVTSVQPARSQPQAVGNSTAPGDHLWTFTPSHVRHIESHKTLRGSSAQCYNIPRGGTVTERVGWGQVEWGGTPCSASAYQNPVLFENAAQAVLRNRATVHQVHLIFDEAESYRCDQVFGYKYIACWTNGDGNHEPKIHGCVVVKIPGVAWRDGNTHGELKTIKVVDHDPFKVGQGRWDVTKMFIRETFGEPLFSTLTPQGFLLAGALGINNLTGEDTTNCVSNITNVKLELRVTVPVPPPPAPPFVLK